MTTTSCRGKSWLRQWFLRNQAKKAHPGLTMVLTGSSKHIRLCFIVNSSLTVACDFYKYPATIVPQAARATPHCANGYFASTRRRHAKFCGSSQGLLESKQLSISLGSTNCADQLQNWSDQTDVIWYSIWKYDDWTDLILADLIWSERSMLPSNILVANEHSITVSVS